MAKRRMASYVDDHGWVDVTVIYPRRKGDRNCDRDRVRLTLNEVDYLYEHYVLPMLEKERNR